MSDLLNVLLSKFNFFQSVILLLLITVVVVVWKYNKLLKRFLYKVLNINQPAKGVHKDYIKILKNSDLMKLLDNWILVKIPNITFNKEQFNSTLEDDDIKKRVFCTKLLLACKMVVFRKEFLDIIRYLEKNYNNPKKLERFNDPEWWIKRLFNTSDIYRSKYICKGGNVSFLDFFEEKHSKSYHFVIERIKSIMSSNIIFPNVYDKIYMVFIVYLGGFEMTLSDISVILSMNGKLSKVLKDWRYKVGDTKHFSTIELESSFMDDISDCEMQSIIDKIDIKNTTGGQHVN